MSLDGKVALITGAGQGVGRGIALAMARAGADIALAGRTLEKVERTAGEVREFGRSAIAIEGSVRDAAALRRFVDETLNQLGGIDILVNNAQEVPLGTFEQVTDEAFLAGFESGPLAVHRLTKMVAPVMQERGGGVIFNLVTSAGVRWDMGGYGAYGAVKQAMRALTRGSASELGPKGIRVLSIAPHAMSPGMEWWIDNNPEEAEAFFKTIPLGRVGDCVEDIGRAVAMLAGDEARYLTGATIPLDGGQANFD
jgi:NAD(P)-dependent dehydrogenase (short-subunit alcohol dehydrogenase family)